MQIITILSHNRSCSLTAAIIVQCTLTISPTHINLCCFVARSSSLQHSAQFPICKQSSSTPDTMYHCWVSILAIQWLGFFIISGKSYWLKTFHIGSISQTVDFNHCIHSAKRWRYTSYTICSRNTTGLTLSAHILQLNLGCCCCFFFFGGGGGWVSLHSFKIASLNIIQRLPMSDSWNPPNRSGPSACSLASPCGPHEGAVRRVRGWAAPGCAWSPSRGMQGTNPGLRCPYAPPTIRLAAWWQETVTNYGKVRITNKMREESY